MADIGPAQRPGAARGGGPDRLLRGHPHLAHGERDAERHAGRERGARVAVGGQGHGGTRVEQPARLRERLPAAELHAGQQGRDHRGRDERVHVVVGQECAMVRRRRAGLGRDPDAGARAEIEYRPLPVDDPKVRQPDITRARTILGWEPKVEFEEGIRQTVDYFKSRLK